MATTKKDYLFAIVAGIATAFFIFPSLENIKVRGGAAVWLLPVVLPILWIIGLFLGKFISRWISFGYQFAKFVIVGFLNTAMDFGVLNFLSVLTGLTGGFILGGVNIPGFILAATNSYFWNKFWVFSHKRLPGEKIDYSDFMSFVVVVLLSVIVNGGIVIFMTTYVSPFFNLSPERWLNVAKVFASVFSLIWNFVGFKVFVFKSKSGNVIQSGQEA